MSQDFNLDQIQSRAKALAAEDRAMRKELIRLRREAGLTQQDVANFMGCTQQAVQKLERYDADPQLSTLRRYANAVGALITHTVTRDERHSLWVEGRDRVTISPRSLITLTVPEHANNKIIHTYGAASKTTDFSLAA